jgi:hypothetical protein
MTINEDRENNHMSDRSQEAPIPEKTISPQKVAANQRNAQRSTGPRTDTGKARSAQNSYKHGFFARNLFHGGEPAGTEGQETTELGEQIWAYHAPVGYIEELLVEKIVCESVRYGRLLGYEQQEFARRNAFFGPAVDRVLRYQAAINRQLFQALQQLEGLQATRKARPAEGMQENDVPGEQNDPMGGGDGEEMRSQEPDGCSEEAELGDD